MMSRLPVITQNFSSPDAFTDTPLMLLPQPTTPPLPDRDQEGFSQLILHDLHRHRQSYVRSYTAFETLKKRQDFVLRQENLRNLQFYEQRLAAKQEQFVDQSIHSYEQCFVKVINGNTSLHPNNQIERQKRSKTMSPLFDKFHPHQLSHIPAMPLDPPPVTPFHRYQRTHRPPKYQSHASLYRSAQSLHDAFQSSSFSQQSQPFVSFTENYLQKYADQSVTNPEFELDTIDENAIQQTQIRSASAEPAYQTKKQETTKSKTPDLQHNRANASSRNTNTPSSTPQTGYNDAVRDGLISNKENLKRSSSNNDKRRSSQQSISQLSSTGSKSSSMKRPKTGKKKKVIVDIITDKKSDTSSITKPIDTNDLLKSAVFIQNYESNTSTKIERIQPSTNIIRKPPAILHRSTSKSSEDTLELKKILETTSTPIITSVQAEVPPPPPPTTTTTTNQIIPEETTVTTTNTSNVTENKPNSNEPVQPRLQFADNRKRIKKGAFDTSNSMHDLVAFELGMLGSQRGAMKRTRLQLATNTENGNNILPENQATLDLLEKIRQGATGLAVGSAPVSQQGCRFELPSDLKLLETLTPLDYLTKYCRLSSRRNYQFKRIFDKHRNTQYRFESSNLYAAIVDIHSETFTRTQYEQICDLIDIANQQHQFTYETFAGILALSERILFESSKFRSSFDERDLAKDTIEKCDFDSLDRKLDGLIISEKMKRLLTTI